MTKYENKPISTKDCFDMATKIGDKIEAAWRQFYIVVLAISAWCFSPNSENILNNRFVFVVIIFAISVFFAFNCIFLIKMYKLIDILLNELYLRAEEGAFIREESKDKFMNLAINRMYKNSGVVAVVGHFICFVAIFIFIKKPNYFN